MINEFKLFSDFVTMLKTVAQDVATLQNIPKEERRKYLSVLDETMLLLDSALLLVINRLGDILNKSRISNDLNYSVVTELQNLDNFSEWLQVERDVRLCSNLRLAFSEMDGLMERLKGRLSLRNPDDFRDLVGKLLPGEQELSAFISQSLSDLARMADAVGSSQTEYNKIIKEVHRTRNTLLKQRNELISTQVEAYNII